MIPVFIAATAQWGVVEIAKYAIKKGKEKAHDKGYREGYEAASRVYEAKYRKLIEDFECDKNKLRREMNKYKQLCKELLEKCEEYERMGYSELADRAKNDYYRLRNAA